MRRSATSSSSTSRVTASRINSRISVTVKVVKPDWFSYQYPSLRSLISRCKFNVNAVLSL